MKVDSIKLQADPSVFPVAGQAHADSQGFKVEGPFKGDVLASGPTSEFGSHH